MDPAALAREYYAALDAEAYDRLGGLLAPEFVHDRPDRTLSGRERFLTFMREERPVRETTHEVVAVYERPGGVAVRGDLCAPGGDRLLAFVDLFAVETVDAPREGAEHGDDRGGAGDGDRSGRIVRVETFAR